MNFTPGPSQRDNTIHLLTALAVKTIARRQKRDVDRVAEEFSHSDTAARLMAGDPELLTHDAQYIATVYETEMKAATPV